MRIKETAKDTYHFLKSYRNGLLLIEY